MSCLKIQWVTSHSLKARWLPAKQKAEQSNCRRSWRGISCFHTHAMGMAAAITSPQPYAQPQDAAHENTAEQLPLLHWCPITSAVPTSKEEIQWAASSPEAANQTTPQKTHTYLQLQCRQKSREQFQRSNFYANERCRDVLWSLCLEQNASLEEWVYLFIQQYFLKYIKHFSETTFITSDQPEALIWVAVDF